MLYSLRTQPRYAYQAMRHPDPLLLNLDLISYLSCQSTRHLVSGMGYCLKCKSCVMSFVYAIACSFAPNQCNSAFAAAAIAKIQRGPCPAVQVTHMPNLEEAIINTVRDGSAGGKSGAEGGAESNGASRPSSPSPQASSPRRQNGAELEIEHSYEGASPGKTPHAAAKAAQILGNEAHQSSDIL